MKLLKNKDLISGALLLALSVWAFVDTEKYNVSSISSYGNPATVPRFVIAIIFIMAVVILTDGIKQLKHAETEQEEVKPFKEYLPVVITFILLAAYVTCLRLVGFVISTFVYMILQMFTLSCFDKKRLCIYLIIACVTAPLLYWVFRSLFNVMLPAGILHWNP